MQEEESHYLTGSRQDEKAEFAVLGERPPSLPWRSSSRSWVPGRMSQFHFQLWAWDKTEPSLAHSLRCVSKVFIFYC